MAKLVGKTAVGTTNDAFLSYIKHENILRHLWTDSARVVEDDNRRRASTV